jgi:hypothetical protein
MQQPSYLHVQLNLSTCIQSLWLFLSAAASTSAQGPNVEDGFFTTSGGVRLHYLEAGNGNPAILFVPGWTMPSDIWEKQLLYFALAPTLSPLIRGLRGNRTNRCSETIQNAARRICMNSLNTST